MPDEAHPYQERIDNAEKGLPGHRIELAWRKADPALERDAVAFWDKMDALPAGVSPDDRLPELVCVAYHEDQVIGLATADIGPYRPLRKKFAFWRVLIHPDYRLHGMRVNMSSFVNSFFRDWARENPEEELAGMGSVVSTTYDRPEGYRPVARVSRAVAVGYNELDQLVRITWFDDVRV